MATIIDGNELSRKKRMIIADEAAEFARRGGRPPGLAVVLVGGDPASAIYVRNKKKACETVGFRSCDHHLDGGTPREELLALVKKLNDDPAVDGILVQFHVSAHLAPQEIQLGIKNGVRKINVDTDNRLAITGAIRQVFVETPAEFDLRQYLAPARAAMAEVVAARMAAFGQAGHAKDVPMVSLDERAERYKSGKV